MQGVLTAPVPRIAIALGKIAGGTTLAVIQATLFLLVAPLADISLEWRALPWLGLILAVLAFSLTGLGFVLAWWLDSTQGFHAIMNLVLVPMWLLSGAVFPASGAAGWIQGIMIANPMTYGVAALRQILSAGSMPGELPSMWVSLSVMVGFGVALAAAGSYSVHVRRVV